MKECFCIRKLGQWVLYYKTSGWCAGYHFPLRAPKNKAVVVERRKVMPREERNKEKGEEI